MSRKHKETVRHLELVEAALTQLSREVAYLGKQVGRIAKAGRYIPRRNDEWNDWNPS